MGGKHILLFYYVILKLYSYKYYFFLFEYGVKNFKGIAEKTRTWFLSQ